MTVFIPRYNLVFPTTGYENRTIQLDLLFDKRTNISSSLQKLIDFRPKKHISVFWHDDCSTLYGMNTEKPNINVNLRRTLLIILGIVVAFLLSFGSRVIALNPQDINTPDRLVTDKGASNEPAISWNLTEKVSDDLTSLFLSKLSQIKK